MATNYWEQTLADFRAGKKPDFTLKNPGMALPDPDEWMKANYKPATYVGSGRTQFDDYGNPIGRTAGIQTGGSANPWQYDYLDTFTNIPSYAGTGNFLEKILSNAPLIAAGSFGLGAVTGGLDQFLAPVAGNNPLNFAAVSPSVTGTMTDAPLLAAEATPELSVVAPSSGPGVTQAGMEWLWNPTANPAGSPLTRVLGLDPATADLLSVGGTLGATGLGMWGSKRKADDLKDLAGQFRTDRAPYLNASQEWLRNPAAYFAGPGKAAMDATIRAVTAQHGNPANNPTAQALIAEIGLRDWRNAVLSFGGLGTGGENTQALLGSREADSRGDVLTTLGGGLSDLINPKPKYKLSIGGITV